MEILARQIPFVRAPGEAQVRHLHILTCQTGKVRKPTAKDNLRGTTADFNNAVIVTAIVRRPARTSEEFQYALIL